MEKGDFLVACKLLLAAEPFFFFFTKVKFSKCSFMQGMSGDVRCGTTAYETSECWEVNKGDADVELESL